MHYHRKLFNLDGFFTTSLVSYDDFIHNTGSFMVLK
jgi:hypothetical protein